VTLPPPSTDRTLNIYLSLAQYPILSTKIRARMRRQLFERGVISPSSFEAEVREKAIRSQALEGLHNPFAEEASDVWELRLMRVPNVAEVNVDLVFDPPWSRDMMTEEAQLELGLF